jgi:hypothetical protein
MSDLGLIKNLDGFPASFQRFEGADRFVIRVNDQLRTITRDHWISLPVYRATPSMQRAGFASPPRRQTGHSSC